MRGFITCVMLEIGFSLEAQENQFFEQERTHNFNVTDEVQLHLELELKRLFGPDLAWEVDQRWSGIMAFGKQKLPIVQRLDNGVFVALKMSGMGIALAGFIGEGSGRK